MLFALEPSWTACWKLLLPCERNLHSPEHWTPHAVTDPSFPDTDFIQRCRSSAEYVEVFHLPQGTAWNILVCSAKVTQSSQDPRQKSSQLQIKNTTSQRARSPIWPRKNLIIFFKLALRCIYIECGQMERWIQTLAYVGTGICRYNRT